MLQEKLSFFMYVPISEAHQRAIYDIISRSVEECHDKMKCVMVQLCANRIMSGSQTYDWMMRMYNHKKPWEIFDLIRALAGMRPSETPWTIYAQEVAQKFKELKDLLATTEGNLTDWWQLMLWQRGMLNIPAVHAKLRKASRELVVQKLNLEEWYDTVAKILQNHYEASKAAPNHPHNVGQAYTLSHTAACPCCGSHETTAQEEAGMAAGALDISKLSEEEIDVAVLE
jgi:hypothetical protein